MELNVDLIKTIEDDDNRIVSLYYDDKKIVVPESLAIILDGNGRYAKKHNLSREIGHKMGCEEINALFNLFFIYLNKVHEKAIKNNVRINFIGDIEKFPKKLSDSCKKLMNDTKDFNRQVFSIAFNYGSRDEIIRAIKKMYSDKVDIDNLSESTFSKYLDTYDIKDPDLLIRTSGECRLSNFLLWQVAYSEMYFTDVLWPEFDKMELYKAIISYNNRERRFGGRLDRSK